MGAGAAFCRQQTSKRYRALWLPCDLKIIYYYKYGMLHIKAMLLLLFYRYNKKYYLSCRLDIHFIFLFMYNIVIIYVDYFNAKTTAVSCNVQKNECLPDNKHSSTAQLSK